MKRILVVIGCLLLLAACKKTETVVPFVNQYTFQGQTYAVHSSDRTVAQTELTMTGDTGVYHSYLSFYFYNGYPTQSGSYTIVSGFGPTAAGQVAILWMNAAQEYTALGSPRQTATVKVNGGKISIYLPDSMRMANYFAPDDTMQVLSGTVSE